MYTADVDIGGTFTDGYFTSDSEVRTAKVLTTHHDLTECATECLRSGAAAFGLELPAFLPRCAVVRLSTTLGTNALLERRGPRIGLLVTRGSEEDLYGGEPSPVLDVFVPGDLVAGVAAGGDGAGAPDAAEVLGAVRRLLSAGARMIAVSLAGAGVDPAPEREVRRIIAERYPAHYLRSVPIQLSSEVCPAIDDEARTQTAVINAYLHREVASGLYRTEDRLRAQNLLHPLLIGHGSGGCARVAKTVAVQTLGSGPAMAVQGAAALAGRLGLERVVTFDVGGTSCDIGLVAGARAADALRPRVGGTRLALPLIEVDSIGVGGGSIAWLDGEGELQVGPRSAGSSPGPACFARGGIEPTVTDAAVVLGCVSPEHFLGGRMRLDPQRAERSVARNLAGPRGVEAWDAAWSVRATAERMMAEAIAARLAGRGWGAEGVTLLAMGGGGPLHVCAVADRLGMSRAVVPWHAPVFSAYGSSTVDVRHVYVRAVGRPWPPDPDDTRALAEVSATLLERATLDVRGEGLPADDLELQWEVALRRGATLQRIACPPGPAGVPDWATVPAAGGAGIAEELVLRAAAAIPQRRPAPAGTPASAEPAAPSQPAARRRVRWEQGWIETPVFRWATLAVGRPLAGPAIIEADGTTCALPPEWQASLDGGGDLVLQGPAGRGGARAGRRPEAGRSVPG